MLANSRTVVAVFCFCSLSAAALAADEARCPPTVSVKQTIQATPAGWTAAYQTPGHVLEGITFYDGPPAEKASLVYDTFTKSKTRDTATWKFTPEAKGRGNWLECHYLDTSVVLSKRLPEKITECKVTYNHTETTGGLPTIETFVCK